MTETRAVTIAAPPWGVAVARPGGASARGGWYSHGVVDMKGSSACEIRPDLQSLERGDIVPMVRKQLLGIKAGRN